MANTALSSYHFILTMFVSCENTSSAVRSSGGRHVLFLIDNFKLVPDGERVFSNFERMVAGSKKQSGWYTHSYGQMTFRLEE